MEKQKTVAPMYKRTEDEPEMPIVLFEIGKKYNAQVVPGDENSFACECIARTKDTITLLTHYGSKKELKIMRLKQEEFYVESVDYYAVFPTINGYKNTSGDSSQVIFYSDDIFDEDVIRPKYKLEPNVDENGQYLIMFEEETAQYAFNFD